MREFAEERQAAKTAVTLLRRQPIMAEDFGARPHSPQSACLEGVRTSDIYIGVFGRRYGYVAPTSGLSATEEEFNEARQRGIPMLCFVSTCEKDPDQQRFLNRVMAYEDGFSIAHYDSSAHLKDKIVQSLHDVVGEPGVQAMDSQSAAQHLDSHHWGAFCPPPHQISLGILIFPKRQGQEYFSLRELASAETQEVLLKEAMFGTPALLPHDHGVDTDDGQDHVVFCQPPEKYDETLRRLSIHTDGSVKFACILGQERRQRHSLFRGFIIDQNEVKQNIATFLRYAAKVYEQSEQSQLISSLYVGMSLSGINGKAFGEIPEQEPSSFGIPMHTLDDPVLIPRQPLAVPRAHLVDPSLVSEELVEQIRRTFRAVDGEYDARSRSG